MKYNQKIIAKNGQEILIRNAEASDGEAVLSPRLSSDGDAFGGIVIRSVTISEESMSEASRSASAGRAAAGECVWSLRAWEERREP